MIVCLHEATDKLSRVLPFSCITVTAYCIYSCNPKSIRFCFCWVRWVFPSRVELHWHYFPHLSTCFTRYGIVFVHFQAISSQLQDCRWVSWRQINISWSLTHSPCSDWSWWLGRFCSITGFQYLRSCCWWVSWVVGSLPQVNAAYFRTL